MAAGRGERLRSPDNKAFVNLGGRPLAWYAIEAFRGCREIGEIVLVVAPEDVERARRCLVRSGGRQGERVVAGGARRQDSVAAALAEIGAGRSLVAVHDGARPFVTTDLIRRCLAAAAAHGAAAAAVPATDTVKEAGADGVVTATLDRSRLWLVQTPQAFRRDLLAEAHEAARHDGVSGTDDASLVERLGHPVRLVEGDVHNIKVTWPDDVRRSEQAIAQERKRMSTRMAVRVGLGYDAHRFAENRPLLLGGLRLRDQDGLLGHSDADVVCHAICDALLGAIGAGDIGRHFPDSDPQYQEVSSLALLERVGAIVGEAGWEIENVDVVVIAEQPRIAPHIDDMRRALAGALGAAPAQVSVKGKTTEGMGFTGRGEGIACQAVAALRPRHYARGRARPEE